MTVPQPRLPERLPARRPRAPAAEALKIGALLSFTGDLGTFGQPIYNGVELAVTRDQRKGGVNGKPIELVKG